MATLPDITELGPTPRADPTRPVGSYDVAPYAAGAQKLAQGVEQLGRGIGQLGEGIGAYELDKSRWQHAMGRSRAGTGLIALDAALRTETNYGPDDSGKDLVGRYTDAANSVVQGAADGIDDPRMRERFIATMAPDVARVIARAQAHATDLWHSQSNASRYDQAQTAIDAAVAAPVDEARSSPARWRNGPTPRWAAATTTTSCASTR